jgi:hypothetical protein
MPLSIRRVVLARRGSLPGSDRPPACPRPATGPSTATAVLRSVADAFQVVSKDKSKPVADLPGGVEPENHALNGGTRPLGARR